MDISAELSKFEAGSKELKFFEKLFEKLGPNFIRRSIEERQREVHCKLIKATEENFQLQILFNSVIKSAEEFDLSQKGITDMHCSTKTSSHVPSLYYNLVKLSLPPEESSKLKPFGLSQEKVSKTYEIRKSEWEIAAFKKLVEDNINDFCKKLILCTGDVVLPNEDWQNAFDRSMKNLESKVTLVSSKETQKDQMEKKLREMIKVYYKELSKGALLLTKALSMHEQKLKFESDLGEYYLERCHAVLLKIKCCEMKILQSTYNQKTMPALRKISAQLDHSEKKLTEDLYEKTVALESYLKLGDKYEHCVDEYTRLVKSIKEQQWALEELKNKNSQDETSTCN